MQEKAALGEEKSRSNGLRWSTWFQPHLKLENLRLFRFQNHWTLFCLSQFKWIFCSLLLKVVNSIEMQSLFSCWILSPACSQMNWTDMEVINEKSELWWEIWEAKLHRDSCGSEAFLPLGAPPSESILKIVSYNWVGIKRNVIRTGFIAIHSLLLYLYLSSDHQGN